MWRILRSRCRTLVFVGVYAAILTASLFLAYTIRFEAVPTGEWLRNFVKTALWLVPVKIAGLWLMRHFQGILSYFRVYDLLDVIEVCGLVALAALVGFYVSGGVYNFPSRGIVLLDFVFSVTSLGALRYGIRVYREQTSDVAGPAGGSVTRIAILGASDVGAAVAADLLSHRALKRRPVVFLDDSPDRMGKQIYGLPVVGRFDELETVAKRHAIQEVIIAIGDAPAARVQEVVKIAQKLNMKAVTVPSLLELASGTVKASRIRPIQIEDLLGREPVTLDLAQIREILRDRLIVVTGAGGSVGSELCRQIASYGPARLLMIEQSEVQLFPIEQEMIELGYGGIIHAAIGDVCDRERMSDIFQRFRPELVFHAAAHKHVPLMERQASEAIKNNVFGTRVIADLCATSKGMHFVLVSTDKAINPTSVMGASKRLAELYVQSLSRTPTGSKFLSVRFGNVLGSSGSVVQIFKRQIEQGGPVTVTHPEVTRYFMTIPEAVGLVLQSATLGRGGEIFVLDMGQPIKVADLARQMIALSGYRPDIDIGIEYIGLRPGEKLFEELQHRGESLLGTTHSRVLRFEGPAPEHSTLNAAIERFASILHSHSSDELKLEIQKLIPEYRPYLQE